jgi:hypothetical protein
MQRIMQFTFKVSDYEQRAIAGLGTCLQFSQSDVIRFVFIIVLDFKKVPASTSVILF